MSLGWNIWAQRSKTVFLSISAASFSLFKKILKNFDSLNFFCAKLTNEIIFYDFKYWSHAGAIVDSVYIKYFNNDVLKASKSVCLAGDYLFYSKEIPPYGMIPAIESGRKAAQFIKNK